MANLLYQQIEMLSREKHIEPEIVVSAIEDAMVVAARKYYKTEEDLRGKFNAETGQVDVFSVLTVVEEVADPKREIGLADAKKKNPTDRKSTRLNSSHLVISYAVFCLKKKKIAIHSNINNNFLRLL